MPAAFEAAIYLVALCVSLMIVGAAIIIDGDKRG